MQVLKDAFSGLLRNKLALAALVALPIICGIFSMFYVSSFIDPTQRLRNLPVAVINQDAGTMNNSEEFNLGDSIIDALEKNDNAHWVTEDESLLEQGLENTDYFMALVIPKGFSEQVIAGAEGEPKTAELFFWRNERKNYTLSQLSARIEIELKESVQAMVTEQYANAMALGLIDAHEGLDTATEGATELSNGAETLHKGIEDATQGSSLLHEGTQLLNQNVNQLAQGSAALAEGAQTLNTNASQFPSGTASLNEGAATLSSGVSAAAAGTNKLHAASAQLATGIDALGVQLSAAQSGSASMTHGLESAYNAIGSVNAPGTMQYAIAQADTCIEMAQLAVGNGGSYGGMNTSEWLGQASALLSGTSAGLSALQDSIGTSQAVGTLSFGAVQLDSGLGSALVALGSANTPGQTLSYGAAELQDGLSTLSSQLGTMETGAGMLTDATGKLVSSSNTLTLGTQQLANTTSTLSNGAELLASGSLQLAGNTSLLATGLSSATEGAAQLSQGSSSLTVALSDGATQLQSSAPTDANTFAEYLGSPLTMQEGTYGKLDYFGLGFAPLFISVALWVGALMGSVVLRSFPSKRIKAGRFSVVLGRMPLFLLFGIAEALAVGVAMAIVGVPVFSWPLAILFLFAVSAAFVSIIQMLSLVFGFPGKALVVLLTILQLAGTSGTLPVELSNPFLQSVTHWLPFTYAIDGIRELMSGGNIAVVMHDALFLSLFALGALIFGLLFFPLGKKMEQRAQKQAAAELAEEAA